MAKKVVKKVRTFQNPLDFNPKSPLNFEPVSEEPSLTVPDGSLTVRELLYSFTTGTVPNIAKIPNYDFSPEETDIDFSEINPFSLPDADISDIFAYADELRSIRDRIASDISAKKKESGEEEQSEGSAATEGAASEQQ